LQAGAAQAVGDGVNQTIQLTLYVVKLASLDVTLKIVFVALEIDLLLKGSDFPDNSRIAWFPPLFVVIVSVFLGGDGWG
jgi:hypothetical protein